MLGWAFGEASGPESLLLLEVTPLNSRVHQTGLWSSPYVDLWLAP